MTSSPESATLPKAKNPWSEGKRPVTCAMMGFLASFDRRGYNRQCDGSGDGILDPCQARPDFRRKTLA